MRQRVISIGDDYVIENDRGERVFKVHGKTLRVRKRLLFEDMHGHELCKIQERMLRVKDSMEIEDPGGRRMAMVQKAMITTVRERWVVKIDGGPDLHVQGNIVDHEYTIERDGGTVAEISKRWFRGPGHLRGQGGTRRERHPDPGHDRRDRRDGPPRPVNPRRSPSPGAARQPADMGCQPASLVRRPGQRAAWLGAR